MPWTKRITGPLWASAPGGESVAMRMTLIATIVAFSAACGTEPFQPPTALTPLPPPRFALTGTVMEARADVRTPARNVAVKIADTPDNHRQRRELFDPRSGRGRCQLDDCQLSAVRNCRDIGVPHVERARFAAVGSDDEQLGIRAFPPGAVDHGLSIGRETRVQQVAPAKCESMKRHRRRRLDRYGLPSPCNECQRAQPDETCCNAKPRSLAD